MDRDQNFNDFFDRLMEDDEELKKEYEIIEIADTISNELIKFRKQNNMTQKEFADLIGVKQQAISRFEKSQIDPRLTFVAKVIWGMNAIIKLESKKNSENIKLSKVVDPLGYKKINKNDCFNSLSTNANGADYGKIKNDAI